MIKLLRNIVGVLFIISGFLKAIDAATFADLMSQYGYYWLGFGAPFVIFIEIVLGLLLLFDFQPKISTISATIFIIGVSCIYLYGILAKGITNCGCFGPLTWLNTKPWLTFVRNGVLLCMLIPSFLKPQSGATFSLSNILFMAFIGTTVMFMCGFSFRHAQCLQKHGDFTPIALQDSPLSSHIVTHADSTYLIFAFSYSCPYCQNSIGNIHQYVSMKSVDKVIGLALDDTIGQTRFNKIFEPQFEIRTLSKLSMARLTPSLPTTFYIRHDSIISQYEGIVISPALLK